MQPQQDPNQPQQVPQPQPVYGPPPAPGPQQPYAPQPQVVMQQPEPQQFAPQPQPQPVYQQPSAPQPYAPVPAPQPPMQPQPVYQQPAGQMPVQPANPYPQPAPAGFAVPSNKTPFFGLILGLLIASSLFLLLVLGFMINDLSDFSELKKLAKIYDLEGVGMITSFALLRLLVCLAMVGALTAALVMFLMKKPLFKLLSLVPAVVGVWIVLDGIVRHFVLSSFVDKNKFFGGTVETFNPISLIVGLLYIGAGVAIFLLARKQRV